MNHRSYGDTKDCKGCRYWSEMLARYDNGYMQACCLKPRDKMKIEYTPGSYSCETWASGELGAIDEPGSDSGRYGGANDGQ